MTPVRTGPCADDERPVARDQRRVADAHAGDVGDRVVRARLEPADPQGRASRAATLPPPSAPWPPPQTAPVSSPRAPLAGGPFPHRAAAAGGGAATSPRWTASRRWTPPRRSATCPGLALLESARPGRTGRWSYLTADPVAVLDAPSDGADPFAEARAMLARLGGGPPASATTRGGLAAVRGRARRLPRLRPRPPVRAAAVDRPRRPAPARRSGSALHDWAIAWDRRTGEAWLAARAVDGDAATAPARRVAAVRERLDALARGAVRRGPRRRPPPRRRSARGPRTTTGSGDVEAVRDAPSRRGEIYQANLTRRLEAPFDGDPWPVFRRLRTGDPALFAGYLDLGPSPANGSAARAAVGLARAVPRGRRRRPRVHGPDQGHAAAGPDPGPGPGAGPRAARQPQGPGRERDDRRRAAQRPRAGLRARAPCGCRGSSGSSGRPPSSTS